jgi:putative ABC transport system permease protein
MSAGVAPWKALVRLAWRDTTRHKGRTALVIALIGVPVAMLLVASVLIRTTIFSLDQKRAVALGPVADLVVRKAFTGDEQTGVASSAAANDMPPLPSGARAVSLNGTYNTSRFWATGHPARPIFVTGVSSAAFGDPILAGVFLLRSGTWPTTNDGVAVTTSLLKYAHLKIGDSIDLLTPKRTVIVTGVYDRRDQFGENAFASLAPLTDNQTGPSQAEVWIDLGPKVTALAAKAVAQDLVRKGWEPTSYQLFPGLFETRPGAFVGDTIPSETTPIAIMNVAGLILLFLLGTIVTAAFAVGARRQLRTLGLIAANGGEPRQLRRLVTLQGTVAAAVGALVGFALGAAGLAAVMPHMNRWSRTILPGVELVPFDLIVAFLMAVLAGSLAAAIPGRTIARVPVLNALGGRRPMRNASNSLPIVGIVLAGLGTLLLAGSTTPGSIGNGWAFAALGGIGVLLGGVVTAPWLVGRLAPLAAHLGGAARLAVRRMTRHRGRSGPIVAAIMATGAVVIAANTMFQSFERGGRERSIPAYALDQVDISMSGFFGYSSGGGTPQFSPTAADIAAAATSVSAVLPGSKSYGYQSVVSGGSPSYAGRWYRLVLSGTGASGRERFDSGVSLVIGNAELLRALKLSDAVINEFLAGKAILAGPDASGEGIDLREQIVDNVPNLSATPKPPKERTISLPSISIGPVDLGQRQNGGFCVDNVCQPLRTTVLIVPEAVATANDLVGTPAAVVISPLPITKAQRESLKNLRQDIEDAVDRSTNFRGFGGISPYIGFDEPNNVPLRLVELITSGLALFLALAVTAVSLALTASDNRPDDVTLASLGAAPGTRRRLRAWEAWLLAASGMALAVPFGFLPAIAIVRAQGRHDPFVFPWLTVAIVVVAVPLLAAAIGWLSARSPRRVSTTLAAE